MPPRVAVHHFSKRHGAVEAVRDVSFTVEAGEIFGLLGPNGAGKTTTLECLVGLREPDAGELTVCGSDVRRQPREVKQKVGVVLQSTALPDKITPREALRLFGALYRESVAPEVLLERFALQEKADARFETLSGGQRQRLALALAFVNRPEVVVLDEPTAGLDPQARREVHAEILRMKQEGHTVLLSTHYLEEAEQLCDRLAIIDRGLLVAQGTPRELIASAGRKQSVRLLSSPLMDPARLAGLPGVEELEWDGSTVRFRTDRASVTLAALTALLAGAGAEIVELQVRQSSLEEVFLALLQAPERKGRDS